MNDPYTSGTCLASPTFYRPFGSKMSCVSLCVHYRLAIQLTRDGSTARLVAFDVYIGGWPYCYAITLPMDLFTFYPRYGVLVSKPCAFALPPTPSQPYRHETPP